MIDVTLKLHKLYNSQQIESNQMHPLDIDVTNPTPKELPYYHI